MLSVNLVMGLIGGLAKFSFRALRLPARGGDGHVTTGGKRAGAVRRDKRDKGDDGQASLRGHAAPPAPGHLTPGKRSSHLFFFFWTLRFS